MNMEMNEEKFLFVFFVVTLVVNFGLVFSKINILDFVFILIVLYYFIKFLVINVIDNYTR